MLFHVAAPDKFVEDILRKAGNRQIARKHLRQNGIAVLASQTPADAITRRDGLGERRAVNRLPAGVVALDGAGAIAFRHQVEEDVVLDNRHVRFACDL
ncbi:hypothetical protein D3C81_1566060 [compost metagenome]